MAVVQKCQKLGNCGPALNVTILEHLDKLTFEFRRLPMARRQPMPVTASHSYKSGPQSSTFRRNIFICGRETSDHNWSLFCIGQPNLVPIPKTYFSKIH